MSVIVAPSLLSADFTKLGLEIEMLETSQADWVHLDIMDGHFVPNITFGMPVIKQLKRLTAKPFDVHLMIECPEKYIKDFYEAGADIITVHFEGATHLHRTIAQIKDLGIKAGVAVNPHTPVELLFDILDDLDMVLVMSVNPGFGGQKFIPRSLDKIKRLNNEKLRRGANFIIQVDGGVDDRNASELIQTGANCLVAGNYIFKSKDPREAIQRLKNSGS
ncbi:MAG TPA: ribulose-phosphate 3-epimerase [Salinivirgaceae bacterium]|nr:ribulose-phosphate 3-epimerase [Salinivirgaceae bacterium]